MNDGGGNGASCAGIKVRTDTTKLSDMVIAYIYTLFNDSIFDDLDCRGYHTLISVCA